MKHGLLAKIDRDILAIEDPETGTCLYITGIEAHAAGWIRSSPARKFTVEEAEKEKLRRSIGFPMRGDENHARVAALRELRTLASNIRKNLGGREPSEKDVASLKFLERAMSHLRVRDTGGSDAPT